MNTLPRTRRRFTHSTTERGAQLAMLAHRTALKHLPPETQNCKHPKVSQTPKPPEKSRTLSPEAPKPPKPSKGPSCFTCRSWGLTIIFSDPGPMARRRIRLGSLGLWGFGFRIFGFRAFGFGSLGFGFRVFGLRV